MAREMHGRAPDERLSTLMDGEITDAAELDRALRELSREDAEGERLAADWSMYHLIGDALRDTPGAGLPRAAFAARLAAEPVVLAPAATTPRTAQPRRPSRWSRWSLPLAASVAGLMVFGWGASALLTPAAIPAAPVAGSFTTRLVGTGPGAVTVQTAPTVQSGPTFSGGGQLGGTMVIAKPAVIGERTGDAASGAADDLDDYLWAHQRYATGTAPWVRLVVERGGVR